MYELWLYKENVRIDITQLATTISWRSNEDELGDEINFEIVHSDEGYYPKNPCELGDMIVLLDEDKKEITRGIIVDEDKTGRNPYKYTAFDFAFYLNKSSGIYQFKRTMANVAIEKILNDFDVPIGTIVNINTTISKIYNSTVSDIIKDILTMSEKKTGQKYFMLMNAGRLSIEYRGGVTLKGQFRNGVYTSDVTNLIMNPSRKRSIVDMKNRIQIVSNDKPITQLSNSDLVSKYGLLQEVVSIDEKEIKDAATIAKSHLNDLGKITEESSVQLVGDPNFRAGRLFEISEPITGIKGIYTIKSVDHTFAGAIHTMRLSLGGVS